MKTYFTFIVLGSLLIWSSCEKSPIEDDSNFLTNAFAYQNMVAQQFNYNSEELTTDSLRLNFQAISNNIEVAGSITFYILYTDTLDTLWLNSQSVYSYATSDEIGDNYFLDTTYSNYVLYQSNNQISKTSKGIFQARFIMDNSMPPIDTLSPDTMVLDSGIFSGNFIP